MPVSGCSILDTGGLDAGYSILDGGDWQKAKSRGQRAKRIEVLIASFSL